MNIGHIELFVADPLVSQEFYTNILGWDVVTRQEGGFIWLQCGSIEVLLRPGDHKQRTDHYQNAQSALVLYTDDLPQTRQQLEARGLLFRGTDGSADCLTFTDPDGHWFQLVDPNLH
ncbi:VOC family protein [Chloroflexi bacterium TSY]|nr:VOC family protein [Chloroflexi bacterium TSY]